MTEVVEKTEHHDPEVVLLVEQRTSPEGEHLALLTLYGILVLLREKRVFNEVSRWSSLLLKLDCFVGRRDTNGRLSWWVCGKSESVTFVQVTLLGLWMIPAFYSFELEFWRFLIVRPILTLFLTLCSRFGQCIP